MKIRVKYLRHDNYKMTSQFLITLNDEVIIGSVFSTDLQLMLSLFYWVCFRMQRFLLLNEK